ncbi:MAG TPA: hypothetical protein VHI98_12035 [Vicinamibacterales bacterium]|jgi:ABC-type amino acid transport system permease subunit|nr:hypothetical protein [Vicinamibacterales bacterium]
MTRHLGRASLIGGVLSWCALLAAVFAGGLDPSPALAATLQAISMTAIVIAVVSVCLGIMAIARGPQRAAAAFGLSLSLLFVLYFTGLGFAVLPNP